MTVSWLKTNSSQGLFLKDRHSIYSIEILSPNHIGIINMSQRLHNSFQYVIIDKIPDLKKESICSIQFCCNIRNMVFPVQNLSILMPNYLTESVGLSQFLLSLIFTSPSNFFLWCLRITNSVFCTLKEILFAFNQSVTFFISGFTYLLSLVIDLLKCSFQTYFKVGLCNQQNNKLYKIL